MSWDKEKARERVREELAKGFNPKVSDHGREMDFSNLGLEEVRRVQGVHVYADIPNFSQAVTKAGNDKQKQRKLLREASVLRKVQGDILTPEGMELIQFQATRLHYLVYRPYDDEGARALEAVISAITLQSYLYGVFNEVFDEHSYTGAVGIAGGESLVANIGQRGDRELISLGTPANLGAKAINGQGTITITEDIYKLLPDCLKVHFSSGHLVNEVQTYFTEGLLWQDHEELKDELGVDFNVERLKQETERYRDELPLSEMEISGAEVLIDLELLTEKNSKRVHAVSIFADLSGFTRRIQAAEQDEDVENEVRNLHIIRQEFHRVVEQDFSGIVIQHQGDCVVAILHVPTEEDKLSKRCTAATNLAIGLQSSMELVLGSLLATGDSIHVAIGADEGDVLVTRLGKKGTREVICLGTSVSKAQDLQAVSEGKEIRVSEGVYDALKDEKLRGHFVRAGSDYVAAGMTLDTVAKSKDRAAAEGGLLVAAVAAAAVAGVTILTRSKEADRPAPPKPWLSGARSRDG